MITNLTLSELCHVQTTNNTPRAHDRLVKICFFQVFEKKKKKKEMQRTRMGRKKWREQRERRTTRATVFYSFVIGWISHSNSTLQKPRGIKGEDRILERERFCRTEMQFAVRRRGGRVSARVDR